MNKALTTQETNELLSSIRPTMTRSEKLHRWADLIRATPGQLSLYSHLENRVKDWDSLVHDHTAFALAIADPVLREAGLKSGSVGDSMRFFELSRDDLHAFSCDCGGAITNADMADRIGRIADGKSTHSHAAPNVTATEVVMAEMARTVNRLMGR